MDRTAALLAVFAFLFPLSFIGLAPALKNIGDEKSNDRAPIVRTVTLPR